MSQPHSEQLMIAVCLIGALKTRKREKHFKWVKDKQLTKKTCFLLALALAKRVSKLHGFWHQVKHSRGWNSPLQELIGSVMVSSLLLPTFGTLSLLLYFRLPSTFLPSKGRSITTLGTRWHDFFFYYHFRYFVLFFSLPFFSFS